MVRETIVKKEQLKISAQEHEKRLREDKISAELLKEEDRQAAETLKKLKERG